RPAFVDHAAAGVPRRARGRHARNHILADLPRRRRRDLGLSDEIVEQEWLEGIVDRKRHVTMTSQSDAARERAGRALRYALLEVAKLGPDLLISELAISAMGHPHRHANAIAIGGSYPALEYTKVRAQLYLFEEAGRLERLLQRAI